MGSIHFQPLGSIWDCSDMPYIDIFQILMNTLDHFYGTLHLLNSWTDINCFTFAIVELFNINRMEEMFKILSAVAFYVYGYVLHGFRTCIDAYVYDCRTLDPFSTLDLVSFNSHEPRTPFMIHVDIPFSVPMNTVTKHINISFQSKYLLPELISSSELPPAHFHNINILEPQRNF